MTHYTPKSMEAYKNDPKVIYWTKELDGAKDDELKAMVKQLDDDITLRAATAIRFKNKDKVEFILKQNNVWDLKNTYSEDYYNETNNNNNNH